MSENDPYADAQYYRVEDYDAERLYAEDEDAALHEYCDYLTECYAPDPVPAEHVTETVEVLAYRRTALPAAVREYAQERVLECVLDLFDEEHSDPDAGATTPTGPMLLATEEYVNKIAAEYQVFPCERVGKRRVPFRTWVEMYRPSVIDPSKEDPT